MQSDHYYYQELAKISQWEPPQWSYCRGLAEALRLHLAQQAASAKLRPTNATAPPAREGGGRGGASKERHSSRESATDETKRQSAAKLKEADEWEEQREFLSSQVGEAGERGKRLREERPPSCHPEFAGCEY